MNEEKRRKRRLASLQRGKVIGVGPFESLGLRLAGQIDGARSLPRPDGGGGWISPHLDRERRAFEEFSARMWGRLQIEEEELYARLEALLDSLARTGAALAAAEEELRVQSGREGPAAAVRKRGEERLTLQQVEARRAREKVRRLAPLTERVRELEAERERLEAEISQLSNRLIEEHRSTRLVCDRVQSHMRQRVDLYWSQALKKRVDGELPAAPYAELESHAEALFLQGHGELMKKIEAMRGSMPEWPLEKEAYDL